MSVSVLEPKASFDTDVELLDALGPIRLTGPSLAKNELENWKIGFFTKTVFFIIQVEIGEVWRCPG